MNERIVKHFLPSGSGMTLVFERYCVTKIPRVTSLSAGALNANARTGWWEILQFSTEIAVYLGNGTG